MLVLYPFCRKDKLRHCKVMLLPCHYTDIKVSILSSRPKSWSLICIYWAGQKVPLVLSKKTRHFSFLWGTLLFLNWFLFNWRIVKVAQLCPTLCDPMGCSLPGSSVHGILQARILEWVAISFSKLKDNCLKILCWFLPYISWSSHRYEYISSLLNLPPTLFHPSGLSQSPGLSSLSHTANSHWLFHTCYSICFHDSLHSSHPLLLYLCPRVCFLCLCPTNRFISATFLDSTYMH